MKLKSFLIIILIGFLLLGTNIVSAGIWDNFLKLFSDEKSLDDLTNDDIFKELILNDVVNTKAIFTLKNPMEIVDIRRENIKVNFVEKCGYIRLDTFGNKKYKLLINDTCIGTKEKEKIYGIKLICYNGSIINNKTKENITKEICYNETFVKDIIYEHYSYFCFKEFEKIDAKDLRDIKVNVNKDDIIWGFCDSSWGYKIDWQIEIILDDGFDKKTLIKSEWAWWNESYLVKFPLNCTNMDNKVPLVINGSNGFEIDGKKQIVWTYCDGTGTTLYLHNLTDFTEYVVANDTTQLPHEVEFGNATSYNPTSVWDSDYKAVYHMNDYDATHFLDSTLNNNNATKKDTGEPNEVNGFIGKAQDFDGDNDYGTVLDDASLTLSTSLTVEAWMNITGMGYSFQKGGWQQDGYAFQNMGSFYTLQSGAYQATSVDAGYFPTNGLVHVGIVISSGAGKIYYNLTEAGSYSAQHTHLAPTDGATTLILGNSEAKNDAFEGLISELRFSNIDRSISFLNQTYQNVWGTSGYGNLLAGDILSYTINGTVKDSNNIIVNNATVIIINQLDNTIFGTTESNSTGGWNYIVNAGIYLVVAYDPNNSTRDGDADPHIIVN